MIVLDAYGYYGSIGDFLNMAANAGFFDYVLPFMFIFAVIFGILNAMNLFKDNKGVNAIIACVVGLMALQFGMVSAFFSQIFPKKIS